MTNLINLDGNGDLKEKAIASYSYSEDATPLDMINTTAGAGQVSVNFDITEGARGSRLLINNELEISDEFFGTLKFSARKYNESPSGIGNLTGETVAYKLNAYRAAPPHGGAGANLFTAIGTYCALVGVTPVFSTALQAKLESIPVNFIGWTGNVWEYLELLCQAVSLDTDDNTYLEMAVIDNELHFRQALQSTVDISDQVSSKSLSVESYDAAQFITMSYYETEYGSNRIVREQNPSKATFAINENVSITDAFQVNAGETIVKRLKVNASLASVNQPVAVAQISTLPFTITGSLGEYVVVGSDDYRIDPDQWRSEGGSLTVRLTDVPDEIEIIVTAPKSVTMPTTDGSPSEVTPAPYKIGVESSGGEDYPALYITGTGVFFKAQKVTMPTGASSDYSPSINTHSIENPFLITRNDLVTRGVASSQVLCGPKVTYSATVHDGMDFGTSIGSIVEDYQTKFRISSASYNESSATLTGLARSSFADFNTAWAGASISNFNSENPGLKFNEFTVIPLVRGE